jgi:hypothetical protein
LEKGLDNMRAVVSRARDEGEEEEFDESEPDVMTV